MIRLTYISSAVRDLDAAAPASILAASRRNNRPVGLTGMLLFDGRRFLQALEGEVDAVERTFRRIEADARHRACVVLARDTITRRAFGDWDMAWRKLASPVATDDLGAAVDAMVAQVDDAGLAALFSGFARVRRPAA